MPRLRRYVGADGKPAGKAKASKDVIKLYHTNDKSRTLSLYMWLNLIFPGHP